MASTRLTRSISSTGSRQKFTYSAWIKRGTLPSSEIFFANKVNSTTYAYLRFTNDELRWMDYDGAANSNLITNRVFRDTSSWYHIVFAFDTTLGSGETNKEERTKLYINGVRETSFRVASYAGHNQDSAVNVSGGTAIHGCNQDQNSDFFTGSMSHIHFIDGTAYDASAFGETDSTTGEWKAKTSPSVTYGTNGFFILKDGNGITDQSGEGNDFTLSGGTLTDLKDNPDNVFATFNPLGISRGQIYGNGNTNTITVPNAAQIGGFSTLGMSSGKYYAEFQLYSFNTNRSQIGVADNPTELDRANTVIGESTYSIAYAGENGNINGNSSVVGNGSSYTTNDIIGVALNLDDNNILFYKNGVVQNSGTAISINAASSTTTGFYFFAVGDADASYKSQFKANFGNGYFGTTAITTNSGNGYSGAEGSSKFNYTVPTGYSALSTKGLNE